MEQNQNTPVDGIRQLLELSLSSGRNWQSPQTGFIQYCYTQQDEDHHDTIPTLENFLFALALMRSKTADNVAEAKDLLNRLFHFQNKENDPSHGNFPVYLHEYPTCKDRLMGVHLLSPLYWIYKNFHHVIGNDLKAKLTSSLLSVVQYCLKTHSEKAAPYHLAVMIAAGAKAIGSLLKKSEIESEGDRLLEALQKSIDKTAWCSPTTIGDLLTAFQMIYPSIAQSPQKEFFDHLVAVWHKPTGSYAGPGWREYQKESEPQPALYDYFMGYYTGVFNYRGFIDHPIQLQAALVHASDDQIVNYEYPIVTDETIFEQPCKIYQNGTWAYSLFAKGDNFNRAWDKTFLPFKLLWGTTNRLRSLVFQGGNVKKVDHKVEGDAIEMYFTLYEAFQVELRDKSQEISFYFDEQEGTAITVEDKTTTTFRLGEEVLITDGCVRIFLKFEFHEGDGHFMGHIMKGNRPSQIALKGENRFSAYDWQIFLRTVRRTEYCVMKATLRVEQSPTEQYIPSVM